MTMTGITDWSANLLKICSVYLLISLLGCSGGSTEKQPDEKLAVSSTTTTSATQTTLINNQTPFAFVERNVTQQNAWISDTFNNALNDEGQSPVETLLPYEFNLGAKLIVRSGLDTNATEVDVLLAYFGSEAYDVKDLNISPDGTLLLFAARGSAFHPTDSSWNIFTYRFADQQLNRIISDDAKANAGQDTNPVLTLDGKIIFSSDRDEGDPLNPRNSDEVNEFCDFEDPAENPTLLHSMTVAGQNITQLTFGRLNHDINPTNLNDGRIAFVRWERSFATIENCSTNDTPGTSAFPSGLVLPPLWNATTKCAYSQSTDLGTSIATNHYKLLTITSDGSSMEQLYQTSTTASSDEAFLMIDQILQAENGNLFSLIRHRYNQSLGGALVELQPLQEAQAGIVLSKLSPLSLNTPELDLYPEQLSQGGWYSAFWPYRDGTSRLLVSWSQCSLISGDVTSFCDDGASGELDVNYGIWVFDPATETRSPIVRAKDNTVFTELAMAQPHTTANLNMTPFDPNFVDNPDGTVVVCHYPNEMPLAVAGADQSGYAGDIFSFDGSASSDPDDDSLTYQWTIQSAPAQSVATLVNSTSVTPSLESDIAGQYVIELVVNDGEVDSLPDSLTVTAMQNNKPVADASNDQTVAVNNLVTLNGSNSRDVDGHPLTYQWSILSQPSNSVLNNPTAVNPTFTPTQIGDYVVQLIVNDGFVDSDPDTVTITVQSINLAPSANAGFDQTGNTGMIIFLDGSNSSDPENAALTYLWSVTSAPAAASYTLINADQVNPSFVANTSGDYVISLMVNDGLINSQLDSVNISINQSNTQPTANAGVDQLSEIGQQLTLNGSASSDPENDSLTYQWSLLSAPAESSANLFNPRSVSPTITLDVVGDYIIQLVVNDGVLSSPPDAVILTAKEANTAPVANAGPDQSANVSDNVQLDGSGSNDANGDTLTYQWSVSSAPAGASYTLINGDQVNPSLVASTSGDYVISLVVNDGSLDSQPDSVNIMITPSNTSPTANAGIDQLKEVGQQATLSGSASSDPENDPLTYQWTLMSVPAESSANLVNPMSVNPTITPDVAGDYIIQLIVNDGVLSSPPDTVVLTARNSNTAPVANAGPDQQSTGTTLLLDGSGSSDVDGDSLTYQWTIVSPANTNATLSDPTAVSPTITPEANVNYVIELVVFDGSLFSQPDQMLINYLNTKPIADAGVDQSATVGDNVQLDGSASSDANGDTLSYQWRIVSVPANSQAVLSNATLVNPTLTADAAGYFELELIVNDGTIDSDPDVMMINTMNENTAPVANAGEDKPVELGMVTSLDGSGSIDADGDLLTYRWEILLKPDSSVASLVNPNTVSPSIEFDVLGDYVFQLIVNDGTIDSAPDTVLFAHENMRPIADAGNDQTANSGNLVSLDGSASYDPDGDALNYVWSVSSQPAESNILLDNPLSVSPTFTPELLGTYVIQLIVNDGLIESLADTVIIETGCVEDCDDEDDQCNEDDESDDRHHSNEEDDDCDDDGDDQCHEDDENDDLHHSSNEEDDDCDDDGDDQCHEDDENDDQHHSSNEEDDDCDDDGDDQ